MRHYTYGTKIQKRVWDVLEVFLKVLLSQANAAIENRADNNDVQIDWHDHNTLNPKLEVRAQLTDLPTLTERELGKDKKVSVDDIRAVLSHYLPKFLGILEDKRTRQQGKGSENWHFIIKVWHTTDLQENKKQFNLEWERKKSGINLGESGDAIDWHDVCRTCLDAEKQRLTNPLSRRHLDIPLKRVKHQQQIYPTPEVFFEEVLKEKCSAKSKETRLAIVGKPRSGKTRLLLRIAEWILDEEAGVPILISLEAIGTKGLDEYLREDWLRNAAGEIYEAAPPNWQQAFGSLIKNGKVWLLLDGADEMTVESPLNKIHKQLCQGWADNVRVILTCRLNVWQADNNNLANFFDVVLLDYSNLGNDSSNQVREFINNWFTGNPDESDRLQKELEKPHRQSIRDLVKNPQCLALLCQTWEQRQGRLPQTKARMYQMFVDAFYAWNKKFAVDETQQAQLNQALGQLALDAMRKPPQGVAQHPREGIARPDSRFQLPESEIRRVLVLDSFKLALKLGWLNQVGLATTSETNPDEKVYAFFHPIFQEYFAAQAINSWEPPLLRGVGGDRTCRIFSPQWKEVMLLWLGRDNVPKEKKEAFIEALVKFKGDSGKFEQHQALFLASAGISEFPQCTQTREIIEHLVKLAFGYFDDSRREWKKFSYRLANKAAVVIQEICRIIVVKTSVLDALIQLLRHPSYYNLSQREAEYLSKIGCGHAGVIAALTHLMLNTHSDSGVWCDSTIETRCWAAYSLGTLAHDKSQAIETLTYLMHNTRSQLRCKAAYSLGKIEPGNSRAIQALIDLLATTKDDEVCCWSTFALEKIAVANKDAIAAALTNLLYATQSEKVLCLAASSLGKINPGNLEAINCLIQHLLKPAKIRALAVVGLKRIAKHNSAAVKNALIDFFHTQTEYDACWAAAEVLVKVEPGNETAIKTIIELITQLNVLLTRDNIENLYWRLRTLKKIALNEQDFAIELLKTKVVGATTDENLRYLVSICLQSIAPNHPEIIQSRDVDVELLFSTYSLFMQKLDTENPQSGEGSVLQTYETISLGTLQLRAGALNSALSTFRSVLELEPRNSYNRLQLVKLYQKLKRNTQVLTMAGFTLCLESDPKVSSQLYNIIGRICQENFELTHRVEDARQAIEAYQSAIAANPDDIVPMWNKVDIYLKLSRNGRELSNEQREQYVENAQRELEELKRRCFMLHENCRRYLPKVVEDMKKTLANTDLSPWWYLQLDVLRILAVQIES